MRSVLVTTVAGISLAILSGCAQSPESIQPSYVSYVPYQSWSCQQLGEEQGRIESALAGSSAAQSNAHTTDILSVLFLGIPVSTLSGSNIAPQIASLKGEQNAVQRSWIMKSCSSAMNAPAATIPGAPVRNISQ